MVVFHNCIKTEVVCVDLQLRIGIIDRTGRPFQNESQSASLSQLGEIIFRSGMHSLKKSKLLYSRVWNRRTAGNKGKAWKVCKKE